MTEISTLLKRSIYMQAHSPFEIHSSLKCIQTYILFAIRFFSSGVTSLVLKIISSHFSRACFFTDDVYSLSCALTTGIRNNEILCFWLVGHPKKAQLWPSITSTLHGKLSIFPTDGQKVLKDHIIPNTN